MHAAEKRRAEEYNERAAKAIRRIIFTRRNFFIIDKGRDAEERCAVKIVNGKYAGYGYFNINEMGFGLSAVHECIKPSADNSDIQVILKQLFKREPCGEDYRILIHKYFLGKIKSVTHGVSQGCTELSCS